MKIGDLIVHIGAKPNGYRIRLACGFETNHQYGDREGKIIESRELVVFVDGRKDWKDCWKVFKGWAGYEGR